MNDNLLVRHGSSKKIILTLAVVFALCLVTVFIVAYGVANLTRQRLAETQEFKYTPPLSPVKDQVRRVLLRRNGENGIEYLEILADGTINLYDANMKLIKSGLQGFGRITNLFTNLEQKITRGSFTCLVGFELTVYTSRGVYTCNPNGGSDSWQPISDLIDEIEDIVHDTLSPTPTLRPSPTPPPGIPPTTPTPYTTNIPPSPIITSPDWNPLTPTPLPGYMTAPPFSCSDYPLGRPFTISNVICGVDQ